MPREALAKEDWPSLVSVPVVVVAVIIIIMHKEVERPVINESPWMHDGFRRLAKVC